MKLNNTYLLVEWPESQNFMEYDWFTNEAILCPTKSSAYFIPENRIITNSYILRKCEELAEALESNEEEETYIYEEWDSSTPFEGGMNTFEALLNLKLTL